MTIFGLWSFSFSVNAAKKRVALPSKGASELVSEDMTLPREALNALRAKRALEKRLEDMALEQAAIEFGLALEKQMFPDRESFGQIMLNDLHQP
ncbi:MAG: hypothetical protein LBH08_01225 [Puniceicoccales bacterium]|nr:hypothetical protein [Puniceicoccales bacterium]